MCTGGAQRRGRTSPCRRSSRRPSLKRAWAQAREREGAEALAREQPAVEMQEQAQTAVPGTAQQSPVGGALIQVTSGLKALPQEEVKPQLK